MATSIEKQLLELLEAQGGDWVEERELVQALFSPRGAIDRWKEILRHMLEGLSELEGDGKGRWRLRENPPQPAEEAAALGMVEFIFAPTPSGGKLPIEIAAASLGEGPTRYFSSLIAPGAKLGPGFELPDGIEFEQLMRAPVLQDCLRSLEEFLGGSDIIAFEPSAIHRELARHAREAPVMSLRKLVRRLASGLMSARADAGQERPDSLRDIASSMGLVYPEHPRALELVKAEEEILRHVLERAEISITEIKAAYAPPRQEIDFASFEFDRRFVDQLPTSPGVYVMSDGNGVPVYVGKAKNLRVRVGSYFRARVKPDEKTERILAMTHSMDVRPCGSEIEALLEEYRLINELSPQINLQLDVHPTQEPREKPTEFILILPSATKDCAELLMVSAAPALMRVTVNREAPSLARKIIAEYLFSAGRSAKGEEQTPELEIVWRWLERNADKVNRIDVAEAGSLDEVMRLLTEYLKENLAEGRIYRI